MATYCAEHKHAEAADGTWNVPVEGPGVDTPWPIDTAHLALRPERVTLVVAHSPCPDGFAAALAAHAFNPKVALALVDHAKLRALGPRVAGERVLFVDIAPKAADLAAWRMAEYAILDHHVTAEADLADVPAANKLFDMNHSGLELAYAYFFGKRVPPHAFVAVAKRDLWCKDHVHKCDEITANTPDNTCPECWRAFLAMPLDELIHKGTELLRAHREKVDQYARQARRMRLRDVTAWVVEVPEAKFISDVGHALASQQSAEGRRTVIALLYRTGADGRVQVSLRSEDEGPDVSQIAVAFGGGGHRRAAGFTVNSLVDVKLELA